MYVKSLYIRNFRNFREQTIDFAPTVTALVGENGVGKSNILFALRLILDSSLSRDARLLDIDDFHDRTSIGAGAEILLSAEFVDFEGNDHDRAYCAKWKIDKNRARVTYRFRPGETARLAASERATLIEQCMMKAAKGETVTEIPLPYDFSIDDYDFERLGGLGSEALGGLRGGLG